MMFQTSGLNTGSVRLDTLITGFCCACAGNGIAGEANAKGGESGKAAATQH